MNNRSVFILRSFLFVALLLAVVTMTNAQDDMDKIRADFEKMLSDPANKFGKNDSAGKFYDIRGFKMYAEVYGQGQPLLFIHGNGGSINNFTRQIPFFSKNYKVIVADSRAQGRSIDPADSLSYDMMADDYAALLSAMHIDSAYVVGWSDGGIEGLLLAIRHPGKVKKLAITGANLRPDSTAVPQAIWNMVAPAYDALRKKENKNAQESAGFKLLRLLMEQPHISHDMLRTIKCPTLVIGGDHDVIKEEHTVEIFRNIPRANLWILPNSGHSTPVVYAEEFNHEVGRFFRTTFRTFSPEARFF